MSLLKNKRGFIDIDDVDWIAAALAVLGALGAWWYVGYLGTGAGIFTKIIAFAGTLVIGYVVATMILNQ